MSNTNIEQCDEEKVNQIINKISMTENSHDYIFIKKKQ